VYIGPHSAHEADNLVLFQQINAVGQLSAFIRCRVVTARTHKHASSCQSDSKVKISKSKFTHASPMTIPPITAHWLRHTFATLLYLSGVDVLTAKEQLGHADVKTTLQIYTHLDKIYKDKNMEKLDEILKSQEIRQKSDSMADF
jgi:site-specific recombinase XerD